MTSPITTTGWNATTGSNLTNPFQDEQDLKAKYFRENYDVMTGLRIAGTLGGFFVLVLLTLLYKSKCKKLSRGRSPVPVDLRVLGPTMPTPRSSVIHSSLQEHSNFGVMIDSPPYMNQINHKHFNKPAVLLTAANSESSDEDLSTAGFLTTERWVGGSRLRDNKRELIKGGNNSGESLTPNKNKMKWFQQSIDIHVILPTPTISPSSSETFTRIGMKKDKTILEYGDYLSVNGSESEMSALVPSSGALCFGGNLKYVDDTSSENIPTRASDYDDQDNDSRRSIGSDSVFACYDNEYSTREISIAPPPPPPPLATPPRRSKGKRYDKLKSVRSNSSSFYDNEDDDECECRMTLTQAQVHHRDSYCGSELEYVNDYMESHRRRSSSTQTTLSDLRQCLNSYVGNSGSNASSQSQSLHSPNPFPHLSPYFNFNAVASPPSSATPIPTTSNSLMASPPNNPILLRVNPINNYNQSRKRSYETLRKTYSLQCDESSN